MTTFFRENISITIDILEDDEVIATTTKSGTTKHAIARTSPQENARLNMLSFLALEDEALGEVMEQVGERDINA